MTDRIELTAQDVRALKHADDLCFDHLPDGTGRIRAIVRAENSDTGFEQVHVITASLSSVESYGPSAEAYTGFHMFMSAKYHDIPHTLKRHLRKGSAFSLRWTRNNDNDILRDAHLVRDELRIKIQGQKSPHADTFLVAVQVGKDNSARMIKAV